MANEKISELDAAATLAGTELLPAVQGGANVAATAEQVRTFTRAARDVGLIVDGDSKAVFVGNLGHNSALHWALARTGRLVRYEKATDNLAVGSTVSGAAGGANTGLISAGRLAGMVARVGALLADGYEPVILLKIGANDITAAGYSAELSLANVRKYWETAKAAGAKRLLLMSVDPRTASGSTALSAALSRVGHATNAAFRAYAAANTEIIFVDTHAMLADPANNLFYPLGGNGASGFVTMPSDGLHEGMYGAWLQSFALSDVLRRIGRPQSLVAGQLVNGTTGWSATEPRGNVLGSSGRFGDTGGGAGNVKLSGGGGVTGADQFTAPKVASAYPELTGTLSGTLAVAISSEPYAPYVDMGRADIKATRLTFSGTPDSSGAVAFNALVLKPSGWAYATTPLDYDADFYCNDLVGCGGLRLTGSVGVVGSTALGGNDASRLPKLNGRFLPHRPAPIIATTDPANLGVKLEIYFQSGVEMSGSIDVFAFGLGPAIALPAATA